MAKTTYHQFIQVFVQQRRGTAADARRAWSALTPTQKRDLKQRKISVEQLLVANNASLGATQCKRLRKAACIDTPTCDWVVGRRPGCGPAPAPALSAACGQPAVSEIIRQRREALCAASRIGANWKVLPNTAQTSHVPTCIDLSNFPQSMWPDVLRSLSPEQLAQMCIVNAQVRRLCQSDLYLRFAREWGLIVQRNIANVEKIAEGVRFVNRLQKLLDQSVQCTRSGDLVAGASDQASNTPEFKRDIIDVQRLVATSIHAVARSIEGDELYRGFTHLALLDIPKYFDPFYEVKWTRLDENVAQELAGTLVPLFVNGPFTDFHAVVTNARQTMSADVFERFFALVGTDIVRGLAMRKYMTYSTVTELLRVVISGEFKWFDELFDRGELKDNPLKQTASGALELDLMWGMISAKKQGRVGEEESIRLARKYAASCAQTRSCRMVEMLRSADTPAMFDAIAAFVDHFDDNPINLRHSANLIRQKILHDDNFVLLEHVNKYFRHKWPEIDTVTDEQVKKAFGYKYYPIRL